MKYHLNAKIKKLGNVITVIASNETLDRHGEVLKIEDWDLVQFKRAPRMLIDHDHRVEKIVGKWLNPRIENGELLLDADFHKITQLSKEVAKMVAEEYLNSVSVGAIYHSPKREGEKGKLELIETSWVTVGANPDALVTMKGLLDGNEPTEDVEKIEEFLDKDVVVENPVEDVEKIATLEQKIVQLEKLNKELNELCEKQNQTLTEQSLKIKGYKKRVLTDDVLKALAQQINRSLQVRNEMINKK